MILAAIVYERLHVIILNNDENYNINYNKEL
jgi:hypothetical protein